MVVLSALVLALSVEAEPAAAAVAELASRTVSVRIHDYAQLDDGTWDVWGVTESDCDWRLHLVAG